MQKVRYVSANVTNSCAAACCAMILGKTLKQVLSDLYEHWEDEGKNAGLGDDVVDQYLAANGYAIQRLRHEYEPNKLLIEDWPVESFAPIHIVDVWSSNPAGTHAVIMNGEGRVYDPSNKKIKSLDQYQRVFAIAGIWKVTAPLIQIKATRKK